jgi:hypothetical protein
LASDSAAGETFAESYSFYLDVFDDDRVFRGFNNGRLVRLLNPRHPMPKDACEQPDVRAGLRVEIAADNRDRLA